MRIRADPGARDAPSVSTQRCLLGALTDGAGLTMST